MKSLTYFFLPWLAVATADVLAFALGVCVLIALIGGLTWANFRGIARRLRIRGNASQAPAYGLCLLAAAAIFPPSANAGNCSTLYQRQVVQQVIATPVVAAYAYAAPLQYAVGSDIQADAIAEKIAQRVTAKLQAQSLKLAPASHDQADPQPGTLAVRATPYLTANCARCHSGAEPKAGLTLDGSKPIDAESFRSIVRMLGTGQGVPSQMGGVIAGLSPAAKGGLTEELLRLDGPTRQRQSAGEDLPPPKPGELK